jgi:hypothetical protein
MVTNNGGVAKDPVYAASSCACGQLCEQTADCEGWTFTQPPFKTGPNNCYIRTEWGPAVDNCNGACYSAKKSI